MKPIVIVVPLLCVLLQLCSSCRKETEVAVQKDTVVVNHTDTVYSTLIRTERFVGSGQFDCFAGCNYPVDYQAETVIRYYFNDSTNYAVDLQAFYSGVTSRKEFNFSVVKGQYAGPDSNVQYLTQIGPDSLKYFVFGPVISSAEATHIYRFSGKRK